MSMMMPTKLFQVVYSNLFSSCNRSLLPKLKLFKGAFLRVAGCLVSPVLLAIEVYMSPEP